MPRTLSSAFLALFREALTRSLATHDNARNWLDIFLALRQGTELIQYFNEVKSSETDFSN